MAPFLPVLLLFYSLEAIIQLRVTWQRCGTWRPVCPLPLVFLTLLLIVIPISSETTGSAHAQTAADPLSLYLRHTLTAGHAPSRVTIMAERLRLERVLQIFYTRRAYRPAWSQDSLLLPQTEVLVSILRDTAREGLDPSDYHVAQIEKVITALRSYDQQQRVPSIEELGTLDLLLSDAFHLYGSHILNGRVSPAVENSAWGMKLDTVDLATTLQSALDRGDVASALRELHPIHPVYAGLRHALARYRELAASGGWPQMPRGPAMRRGLYDPRIVELRTRLRAEGYLSHEVNNSEALFDASLDRAVRTFQQRQGLDDDGVVGPATLMTLNIPIETRIQQLALNMERWRWLPRDLGSAAVIVNTAGFTLEVIEAQAPVLTMRIIVGKPHTRTPSFHTAITAIELNPAWHIPTSIASKELLPLIRSDPHYLATHHISIVRNGHDTDRIDPATINWIRISARSFPYHLRQEPGPWNALGRLKFHLSSPFSIYLHDTPTQALFTRPVRAFSHGCIRIEKPLDLAAYFLRDTTWTRDALQTAIEHDTRETIRLIRPVPVYIGYWTAWVEQDGAVHFRPDLYGQDRRLTAAIRVAYQDQGEHKLLSLGCP